VVVIVLLMTGFLVAFIEQIVLPIHLRSIFAQSVYLLAEGEIV
jgi:hypothetical protein